MKTAVKYDAVFYFDDSHKTEKRFSIAIQRKPDDIQTQQPPIHTERYTVLVA